MLRKNVAGQFVHIAAINATTGAALTGATVSMRRCLDGTFAAGGATITEDTGLGFYKVALTQADTNGNDIAYFFTATNMIPICLNVITTACDPTSTAFGLSLAKTTNITGFNDIAATSIVSSGAITTSGGAVSTVTDVINRVTANTDQLAGQTVTAAAGVTFPTSVASPTNITAGTITTVTNLTNLPSIPANWLTAAGMDATASAEIADAVWDEAISGHLGAGSTGAALNAAGSAGDPWTTPLPGAYGAGTAGYIIGTNVDALISDVPTAAENADALLGRNVAGGSSSGRLVKEALYALRNKWTVSGGTYTVYATDDTTTSWTSTATGSAGADPIVASDPT